MASVWVRRRPRKRGGNSFRVEFRPGGREAGVRFAGSFPTLKLARARRDYVLTELAAGRMPDLRLVAPEKAAETLTEASERWRASRVDVAESTRVLHRVALARVLDTLGARRIDEVTTADVAELVAALTGKGYRRETVRKSTIALAQVLDFAGRTGADNPARDRVQVRLPREEREELNPPTAAHVEAVLRLLPSKHRLALLFLEWSGARVGAVDSTLVSDYDEPRRRVRLRAATQKTRRALWVELHPALADALEASLGPREDRDPAQRLFAGSGADALRPSIVKACRAAGIPLFSPHDLRHRRISLLHARGVSWAAIGQQLGQRNLAVTANTYSHVMGDEAELDYESVLT
jgi:integrase